MKRKMSMALILVALIFQVIVFPAEAKEIDYKSPEFKAVASQFLCTCGCNEDHYECDPNTCSLTASFKKDLVKLMNKGWDKDKIRDYYVKIYGEAILTAPEKSGFSLTAWVLPFVVLGIAALSIVFIIRKWVKRKGTDDLSLENGIAGDEIEREIISSIIDEERKKYL